MKHIDYDPETGIFIRKGYYSRWGTWVARRNELTRPSAEGYILVMLNANAYKAHRLAFLYMFGVHVPHDMEVDHIDGVRSNNRFCNLRIVDRAENQKNKSIAKNNTTGVHGVCRYGHRFRARINHEGKRISLGLYDTVEEAEAVRKQYEELYGYSESHGRERGNYASGRK